MWPSTQQRIVDISHCLSGYQLPRSNLRDTHVALHAQRSVDISDAVTRVPGYPGTGYPHSEAVPGYPGTR
eukprot:1737966-Rhodomonas_salina.1